MTSTVTIFYGDSELRVVPPVVHAKKNNKIQFNLHPKTANSDPAGVDYNAVIVTIRGKKTAGNWLNVSGKGKNETLEVTAPDPGGKTPRVYEYMVTVQEVGQLDPRAEIDPF